VSHKLFKHNIIMILFLNKRALFHRINIKTNIKTILLAHKCADLSILKLVWKYF